MPQGESFSLGKSARTATRRTPPSGCREIQLSGGAPTARRITQGPLRRKSGCRHGDLHYGWKRQQQLRRRQQQMLLVWRPVRDQRRGDLHYGWQRQQQRRSVRDQRRPVLKRKSGTNRGGRLGHGDLDYRRQRKQQRRSLPRRGCRSDSSQCLIDDSIRRPKKIKIVVGVLGLGVVVVRNREVRRPNPLSLIADTIKFSP